MIVLKSQCTNKILNAYKNYMSVQLVFNQTAVINFAIRVYITIVISKYTTASYDSINMMP